MFGKDKPRCSRCKSNVKDSFDFCPYCGNDLRNFTKDKEDFGLLGKSEVFSGPFTGGLGGFGITDKMLNSLFKSLMKNLEKQMGDVKNDADANIERFPNGIRINFGSPIKKETKRKQGRVITKEQISKMSGLPRVEAKTNVRRLTDKVVYELNALGVDSIDDVFVTKLENGYEVKAIGKKKVYVNSLPVNLPLKRYSLKDKGLVVEFGVD